MTMQNLKKARTAAPLRLLTQACCIASLIAVSPALAADDITEQIELGLELYQEGSYGEAITELEFAITDIRKLVSGRIAETFPDAPEGWTAEDIDSSGGADAGLGLLGAMGGGTMLERNYQEVDGNGHMEASIAVDHPMIQGLAAMFNNPALIAAQPNTERIRIGRDTGTLTWEADQGRAEATVMLNGRIMIKITGTRLDSADPVRELLSSWDIKALRASTAR